MWSPCVSLVPSPALPLPAPLLVRGHILHLSLSRYHCRHILLMSGGSMHLEASTYDRTKRVFVLGVGRTKPPFVLPQSPLSTVLAHCDATPSHPSALPAPSSPLFSFHRITTALPVGLTPPAPALSPSQRFPYPRVVIRSISPRTRHSLLLLIILIKFIPNYFPYWCALELRAESDHFSPSSTGKGDYIIGLEMYAIDCEWEKERNSVSCEVFHMQ
ncbi:hypothetical protein C8R44DRAFT_742468 [Mycena epipterygia]|nr:hypothetical protein C8R44DRAFT_742468 [Mycena epipterygia]